MPSRRGRDWGGGATIVACATGLLLATVLPQYLVASFAVEIRADFRFSDAQLGAAVAISFALAATISPTAGRAVSRVGIKRGVGLAAGLIVASSIGMITVASSAEAVIALMAVNGLGGGVGSPSLSAMLAENISGRRHGAAFGLFTSAPQIAAVAAGLALPLVAQPFGWRTSFVVPIVIALVSVIWLLPLRTAKSADRAPAGARRRLPRSVHAIAGSAALASAAGIGMRSFLVVFAVWAGFERSLAGLLLAVTGIVALASRVGFGLLSDRSPRRSLTLAAALMALSGFGFILMAAGGHAPIVAGALLAGGLGWGWQAPLSHAVVHQNPDATAPAVGIQMSGFFAGAVVGPLMVGLFARGDDYATAWVACAALAAGAVALALLADRIAPARHRPEPLSKVGQT